MWPPVEEEGRDDDPRDAATEGPPDDEQRLDEPTPFVRTSEPAAADVRPALTTFDCFCPAFPTAAADATFEDAFFPSFNNG